MRTVLFLSTPSARRATIVEAASGGNSFYFYPRPPRGGRRLFDSQQDEVIRISIHALREEGDGGCADFHSLCVVISIHALREEGDAAYQTACLASPYFYPRPPRGGRPQGIKTSKGAN